MIMKKRIDPVVKEEVKPQGLASTRIEFDQIQGMDEKTYYYVNRVKEGYPQVLNFELVDVKVANKVLAFLAGAMYALDGRTIKINDMSYLFALSNEFLDGSLNEWLNSIK